MSYVSGKTIKELREKKKYTQKQLAHLLQISDKTVSKWETDRGLPDVSLITGLAEVLGVSVAELLMGEVIENDNPSANIKKLNFYICPICGNVIQSIGIGSYSCCGVQLPVATVEENDVEHEIFVEDIDGEYYVHMNHSMSKTHYISFVALVTSNRVELVRLYPEQNVECRLAKRGHGYLYIYCNKHGLYRTNCP